MKGYIRAIELNPELAEVYLFRSQVYDHLGDTAKEVSADGGVFGIK
ncbi:MAG: hypothetical protein KAT09_04090 [Candidatus Aegiribacteria sp.]|nr:hypothetical protein [Candidatus Aegiribacteria sp.]